jgi:ABC-type transporter Mla subunit MlaD
MQYADVVLTVLTACVLAGTIGLLIGLFRLSGTLSRLDRFSDRAEALAPQLEKMLVEAQGSLASAERLTDRLHDIAADAHAVSAVTREELVPVIHRLSQTGSAAAQGFHHVSALVAATRAGLHALGSNGNKGAPR